MRRLFTLPLQSVRSARRQMTFVTRVLIVKIKRLAFLAISSRMSMKKVVCSGFHASKTWLNQWSLIRGYACSRLLHNLLTLDEKITTHYPSALRLDYLQGLLKLVCVLSWNWGLGIHSRCMMLTNSIPFLIYFFMVEWFRFRWMNDYNFV